MSTDTMMANYGEDIMQQQVFTKIGYLKVRVTHSIFSYQLKEIYDILPIPVM